MDLNSPARKALCHGRTKLTMHKAWEVAVGEEWQSRRYLDLEKALVSVWWQVKFVKI